VIDSSVSVIAMVSVIVIVVSFFDFRLSPQVTCRTSNLLDQQSDCIDERRPSPIAIDMSTRRTT